MQIVLGSQSPRRRELLADVVAPEQLTILPPRVADEPGFDGLTTESEIERQLSRIVHLKHVDVQEQLREKSSDSDCCVICADTIVVAATDENTLMVLGKPPEELWRKTVRGWFTEYYSGRSHEVWTCCRITGGGRVRELTVKTRVRMCKMHDWQIEWYLSTGESVGKAGGYGIQGNAAVFIEALEGSLTNVIGLPTWEVLDVLREFGVLTGRAG